MEQVATAVNEVTYAVQEVAKNAEHASSEVGSAENQAAEIEKVPLKRIATARDQAGVIAFLLSSDADFVTGLTIDVSGGLS